MKKKLILFLAVLTAALLNTAVFASGDIKVNLNGNMLDFDVPPQIMNGRTMVPMRKIFESLGATVEWNGGTQTVTAKKIGMKVIMTVGSNVMQVNDREVSLDTAACVTDGRTLVPVRAIAEAFGTDVNWDGNSSTVTISRKNVDYQSALNRLRNGLWAMGQRNGSKFFTQRFDINMGYSMITDMEDTPMISIYQESETYKIYYDLLFFGDFVSYGVTAKQGDLTVLNTIYVIYPNESEWKAIHSDREIINDETKAVVEAGMPTYLAVFDRIFAMHNLGCTLADFGIYY